MGRYGPWLLASVLATACAAVLIPNGATDFERFLGPLPPTAAVAVAGVAGLAALRFLELRGFWRRACMALSVRGLALASAAVVPFAVIAITVDIVVGFPRDTNVAWPQAWLLYPAVALVVETALHLLPLAGLVWLTRYRSGGRALDRHTVALVLVTATLEPLVQIALDTALPAFTVVHVYAFGVVQLLLLRRYGYLPMLWFRLCYYLLWHVLWGAARLELLF